TAGLLGYSRHITGRWIRTFGGFYIYRGAEAGTEKRQGGQHFQHLVFFEFVHLPTFHLERPATTHGAGAHIAYHTPIYLHTDVENGGVEVTTHQVLQLVRDACFVAEPFVGIKGPFGRGSR